MQRTSSERLAIAKSSARPGLAARLSIVIVLLALAAPARAQLCPGSHIYFVVRDAKGNAVDGADKTLTVAFDGGTRRWSVGNRTYDGFASLMPAALLGALKDKVAPLMVSAYCNFRTPVTLRVTMSGKTQELTFLVPQLGQSESRIFLVEGPPLQAGRFEITMAITAPGQHLFYPASGWIKK